MLQLDLVPKDLSAELAHLGVLPGRVMRQGMMDLELPFRSAHFATDGAHRGLLKGGVFLHVATVEVAAQQPHGVFG